MKKQLPKNWVETELGNYAMLKNGYAFKSNDFQTEGLPVVKISNIKDFKIEIENSICVDESKLKPDFIIAKGDILIAMSGATTGKYGVFEEDVIALQNQRVGNLKPIVESLSNRRFLLYLLGSLKEEIEEKAYGAAQPNISPKLIESINIFLPPLTEQNRIVDKLDRLFAQLETIKTSMSNIPLLLKDFRQQVLTQAVTGKLTEEWRKRQELGGWNYKKIEKITLKVGSGSTPTGGQAAYLDEGIPLIRSMNVHFNGIKYEGLAFLNENQANGLKNVEVFENDILLNITGASIGRVCLAPKDMNGARVNQHVCIIRVNNELRPSFLNIYLSSPIIQNLINNGNYGVTRQSFTKAQILELEIPIPVMDEQEIILSNVESLFAKADAIEQQYKTLKASIDNLPQALLHKAFKGELVPQLESDGDAKDLLEEIKRLKDTTAKVLKNKTNKSTAKKVKNYP
jgi:type I restriction enzyme S subunit